MAESGGEKDENEAAPAFSLILEAFPSVSLEGTASASADAGRNPLPAPQALPSSPPSPPSRVADVQRLPSTSLRFRSSIPPSRCSRYLAEFFPPSGKISYSDLCTSSNTFAESLKSQGESASRLQDRCDGMASNAACKKSSHVTARYSSLELSEKGEVPDKLPCHDKTPRNPRIDLACKTACKALATNDSSSDKSSLVMKEEEACRLSSAMVETNLSADMNATAANNSLEGTYCEDFPILSSKAQSPRTPRSQISKSLAVSRPLKKASTLPGAGLTSNVMHENELVGFGMNKQDTKVHTTHVRRTEHDTADSNDGLQQQAAEFLFSMLGDRFQLGIEVVQDVLGYFNGDMQKSLDSLIHMAETNTSGNYDKKIEMEFSDDHQLESGESETGSMNKDPDFTSWEAFLSEHPNHMTKGFENVLPEAGSGQLSAGLAHNKNSDLSKSILQSLFKAKENNNKVPNSNKICKKQSRRHVVLVEASQNNEMHMDAASSDLDSYPLFDDFDEYDRHRTTANQHWQMMKYYFKEAATTYTRGEHAQAALLSEQGNIFKNLAIEAKKQACAHIFHVKNEETENNITIDLRGMHVGEALLLLKLHLKSFMPIHSVCTLTVITGSDLQSVGGHSKTKKSVIHYLDKKGIDWTESNPGCLIIKIKNAESEDRSGIAIGSNG